MIKTLQGLLAPHEPTVLLGAMAAESRLHLRTDRRDAFRRLLPWSVFNELLTVDHLLSGDLIALRNGHRVPLEMVTQRVQGKGRLELRPGALQELCATGLSLRIRNIEKLVPAIAALAATLERQFRGRMNVNAYASFNKDSALGVHRDDHDVVALHIHGRKRWFCHGRQKPGPATDEAAWDAVLEPGDILYVPRGDYHRAEVSGAHSVHLTFSLTYPRGSDVIRWMAQESAAGAAFRTDIKASVGGEGLLAQQSALRGALHRLVEELDLTTFLAANDLDRPWRRPVNLGVPDIADPAVVIRLMMRRRVPLPLDGPVELKAGEARISLSATERAALAVLFDRDTLTIGELCGELSGIPGPEVRDAVAGLARQGLVLLTGE